MSGYNQRQEYKSAFSFFGYPHKSAFMLLQIHIGGMYRMKGKHIRLLSVLLAVALLIPSGWLAPAADAADEKPTIPVLLYHRVVANPTSEWTDTSISKFTSTMKYLDENGFTTLSAEQYVDIMDGVADPADIPEKPILLTFDDATPDFVTNTVPILKQYNMNAVQFVATGWINGSYSISKQALEELAENNPNISLQNHSVNHAENTWKSMTKEAASTEIAQANSFLKDITGKDPVLFAYPYGDNNAAVQSAMAENGIKYAFKVGYPNAGDHALGRHYVMMSTTLEQIAGWLGGPAPKPDSSTEQPKEKLIYHETFESGLGVATQAGSKLVAVSDVQFTGNEDGAAIHVTERSAGWHGADIPFSSVGMENGKTYTITITGYVAENATVPTGAKALLQNVDTYNGLYVQADLTAGQPFTLTGNYTVNTAPNAENKTDRALRIQSNNEGASVPFYIGDITIVDPNPPKETDPKLIISEGFETGKGNWTGNGAAQADVSKLLARTGEQSFLVSGRTQNYNGPSLVLTNELEKGATYQISGYVKLAADAEAATAGIKVTMEQTGAKITENSDKWLQVVGHQTTTKDDWVLLSGSYTYNPDAEAIKLYFESDSATISFALDDFKIEKTSGGSEEPEQPEEPREPALPFSTLTFEDQELGGFAARGDTEVLTVTDEANHSENGTYAVKITNRTKDWHGPSLHVEKYVDLGSEYNISAWVKLASPNSAQLKLSTQVGTGGSASYINLQQKTVSTTDGWVKLEGKYRYTTSGGEYLTLYIESSSADAVFYIDDISFIATGSEPIKVDTSLTPLKETYGEHFLIGNIVSAQELQGVRLEQLKYHHNIVTAENAMKPDGAYNADREFDFTDENAIVDKALAEGLQMFGHVLVWHQQTPTWLHTDGNGQPLTREQALANMEAHITAAVENFGDKVIGWDVVNEAMNDNPANPEDWKGALRKSGWYNAIGPDFVEQAFRIARKVLDDNGWSDLKLYYNDYNDDNQNKATAIYSMVKELNEKYAAENNGKLLVDGIGMQAHYNLNTNPENVRLSLERFISLGVEVSISELDITAGTNNELTEEQAQKQGYLFAQLMELYKEHSEHISRVTFWGLEDGSSWRAAQSPLLFDRSLKAKPAFYAVNDPAAFLEDYAPVENESKQSTALYGTPVIDGEIDEIWAETATLPIDQYQMAWQGAKGIAKALWDEQNLYVLIQVNDAQLDKASANAYEQDSVEVFLDQKNGKATFYQAGDGQYRVNFDNEASFNPASIAEGFESKTIVNGTNYTVELKIPFTEIEPKDKTKIGFDAQINDAKDGARQSVAIWNDLTGRGFENPSVFGVLTLLLEPDSSTENPGTNPGTNSGSGNTSTGTVTNGTIAPEVTTANNKAIGKVTAEQLKQALEQAKAGQNGQKQLNIELAKQANAGSYEAQLPAKGLQGADGTQLSLKTPLATITIPNQALQGAVANAEQISIVVAPASTEKLDAAAQEKIGSRPAVTVSLLADNKAVANSNAAVTISIPYTPSAAERDNAESIVVWQLDEQGNKTTVINGHYDAAAGTVTFQSNQSGSFAVAYAPHSFADAASIPWAKQAIEAMAARDVIKGVTADSYAPQQSISRADFITLLVRALGLQAEVDTGAAFSDVEANAYYYNELAIAKTLGIVTGYSDSSFKPAQEISRQDMMVLAARALAAAGKELDANGSLGSFSDSDNVAQYAQEQAAALVKAGIVNGKDGKLAPQDTLTRAESAVILYRIWKLQQ